MKKAGNTASQDFFTQIAQTEIRDSGLRKPNDPLPFEKCVCTLDASVQTPCAMETPMHTKEQLYDALAQMRRSYAPYLEHHAPELPVCNQKINLREFVLDGQETVTVPHYGGPLGNAVQTYTAEFTLDRFDGKAVYICFRGADYIAKIYVNDICVGIHEGFFAPFAFEITAAAKEGSNHLTVVLENDFIYRGSTTAGEMGHALGLPVIEGDKLYAATGIGYDDPEVGWHHCPAAMGLYGDVFVEIRNTLNITDLYVRPLLEEKAAELWLEVENTRHIPTKVSLRMSLYGDNFPETVFENLTYTPVSGERVLLSGYGKNVYKVRISVPNPRVWALF